MDMKNKVEFVAEDIIEKMIAALQENCDRLPLGKPRTAVLQLLVPYIMNNIERGESARKIVSILNNLCYIVNKEDIDAIVAAHTNDAKQDSTKRKRRSKTSEQNKTENDQSVKKESSELKKEASGEEKLPNEVENESANRSIGGGSDGHYEDDFRGVDGHEKDIGAHIPEPLKDTAGDVQGQNEAEQVPKNDGTFVVKPDIEDI